LPVAVLTNVTLLNNPKLRTELDDADIVLPSLDAATKETLEAINNPHSKINIQQHISGLIEFSKQYKCKLCLEVMILPGYNNQHKELLKLKETIGEIKPDCVQLNTLDRPVVVKGLRPAPQKELERIEKFLGLDKTEIVINSPIQKETEFYIKDMEYAILNTISHGPCTIKNMAISFNIQENIILKHIIQLMNNGKIVSAPQKRGVFYKMKE